MELLASLESLRGKIPVALQQDFEDLIAGIRTTYEMSSKFVTPPEPVHDGKRNLDAHHTTLDSLCTQLESGLEAFQQVYVGQGKEDSMADIQPPLHTRIRRTAYDLWRGPNYLQKKDDNDPVGGYCVLRLAIRKGISIKPLIEARAVYTILGEEMEDAIIRAVYWDSHTFVRNLPPEETVTKIPVKFVQVPGEQLQDWFRAFAGLKTAIQISVLEDNTLPICSLRVETSAVDCSFEKVWQVVSDEDIELNCAWQQTWQEMGQALQNGPGITDVEESFPGTRIEPDSYDFEGYQPSLGLP